MVFEWEKFKTYHVHSLNEFADFTKDFLSHVRSRSIFLLDGPMGVGKTEFVRQLGLLKGFKHISSPTFSIHQQYENEQAETLDHFDLYRLKDINELETTGIWDLMNAPEGLIAVEWPTRIDDKHWPLHWDQWKIVMELKSDQSRWIQVYRRQRPANFLT